MKQEFRLPEPIRTHIIALGELMYYANSRNDGRWANQTSDRATNGVFGHAHDTVEAIIREMYGEEVLHKVQTSRYGYNFGGNGSFGRDIEVAIEDALEELELGRQGFLGSDMFHEELEMEMEE